MYQTCLDQLITKVLFSWLSCVPFDYCAHLTNKYRCIESARPALTFDESGVSKCEEEEDDDYITECSMDGSTIWSMHACMLTALCYSATMLHCYSATALQLLTHPGLSLHLSRCNCRRSCAQLHGCVLFFASFAVPVCLHVVHVHAWRTSMLSQIGLHRRSACAYGICVWCTYTC